MTKAVFFDWDGTLVDSLPLLYASHNHVREKLGFPLWSMEEYLDALVFSTRELYPRLYGERAQEGQDLLYSYIIENHLQQITLLEGAEDVLKALQERGIPMGLVSNKRNDVLRREVEHLGWEKYFDIYMGAGVAKKDKPSGEPLIYALGLHPRGLTIDQIIYVGDTESDLSCAKEAGCPVAFIRHTRKGQELIEKYRPAYVVNDLHELKDVLIKHVA